METFECNICCREFQSICSGNPYGYGCSSTVTQQIIRCSFGSNKDLNQYSWVGGTIPNEFTSVENICDDCIDQLEVDKVIEYGGEYNPLNDRLYK